MKTTFLLHMPTDLKASLKKEAMRKGMTLTGLITTILNAHRDAITWENWQKQKGETHGKHTESF